MDAVQKGGYPHFMLKEIHEQPQVAREVLHLLDGSPDVQPVLEKMRTARQLYFVGCGTSYHACLAGAVYFAQIAGRAVIPVLAPQFIPQYLPAVNYEDVGLFVSQSGETKDVLNALQAAEAQGHDRLRAGQRDRLHPDQGHRLHPAAVLRLRDQRPGHQDLHQPGGHLPVPGVSPGRARYRRTGADPGPDGKDPGDGRPAGGGTCARRSTTGTTCIAWVTAPPTRSRWRGR